MIYHIFALKFSIYKMPAMYTAKWMKNRLTDKLQEAVTSGESQQIRNKY